MQRIEFHYETDFKLRKEGDYRNWVTSVIESEKYTVGYINYVFCDDSYLADLHKKYMGQDDFTDIITFDYVERREASGDIFISVERVKENAQQFGTVFDNEMCRVMSHGLLHLMGYKDKTKGDIATMRAKEDEKIKMFHVEQ